VPATDPDLAEERAHRWWQRRRPVRSLARAAAFVDDVAFSLVYPTRVSTPLPSLYQATSDRPLQSEGGGLDWSPDAQRVWEWKDELPLRGLAWYGRFLRGGNSLLSVGLLADLYPWAGRPDDFRAAALGEDARRIAETILLSGPTSTALLREAVGAFGPKGRRRFDRAQSQLGRALLVTNLGVETEGSGWPAAVLELTARAFPAVGRRGGADDEEARLRATRRFLDTMIQARPYELGNAFGWGATAARSAFETLVGRGEAVRRSPAYRLAPTR
jgi:hypothetical protein